jgi:hypothetical protein
MLLLLACPKRRVPVHSLAAQCLDFSNKFKLLNENSLFLLHHPLHHKFKTQRRQSFCPQTLKINNLVDIGYTLKDIFLLANQL